MKTFTAQELADFYKKVADGGLVEFSYTGTQREESHPESSPHMGSYVEQWRIKPKKPVDLSVLIDSSIDCEFWDDADQKFPVIGKLTELGNPCISYKYVDVDGMDYKYCRPRMNHVHAWQGGECPLPDGLRVKVFYQNPHIEPAIYEVGSYNLTWHWYGTESDIIAFEVVGLVDGYCWPWEME